MNIESASIQGFLAKLSFKDRIERAHFKVTPDGIQCLVPDQLHTMVTKCVMHQTLQTNAFEFTIADLRSFAEMIAKLKGTISLDVSNGLILLSDEKIAFEIDAIKDDDLASFSDKFDFSKTNDSHIVFQMGSNIEYSKYIVFESEPMKEAIKTVKVVYDKFFFLNVNNRLLTLTAKNRAKKASVKIPIIDANVDAFDCPIIDYIIDIAPKYDAIKLLFRTKDEPLLIYAYDSKYESHYYLATRPND